LKVEDEKKNGGTVMATLAKAEGQMRGKAGCGWLREKKKRSLVWSVWLVIREGERVGGGWKNGAESEMAEGG
jgi:hypothetical protein